MIYLNLCRKCLWDQIQANWIMYFLTAEFLSCCRSDLTRCCWKRRKNQRLAWRSWIYCRHVPGFIYIFIPYSKWPQKILTIHIATNCYTESSNGFSLGMEFSNIIFCKSQLEPTYEQGASRTWFHCYSTEGRQTKGYMAQQESRWRLL